jgi:hypothetical protein
VENFEPFVERGGGEMNPTYNIEIYIRRACLAATKRDKVLPDFTSLKTLFDEQKKEAAP